MLGVVHILDRHTYSGIPVWVHGGKTSARPAHDRRPAERKPPCGVGSRRTASDSQAIEALGAHELRPAGSSIKLCLVAEGAADLYPRLGPTSEWDIAAGQAVVEAAGGQVVRLSDGQALRYNEKPDLLSPQFLAYGDPDCYRSWPRS